MLTRQRETAMRRRIAFGAVVVIVPGVVGFYAVGPAASATNGTSSGGRTIRLFEHDTQQGQIDLGDKGPSPGDQFIAALKRRLSARSHVTVKGEQPS